MSDPWMYFPDKFDRGLRMVEDPFKPHDERCTCTHGHALLCPQHAEEAMELLSPRSDDRESSL